MSQLTRVTYVSRSTFKPFGALSGIEPNVARILSQSRRNNMRRNLVGVLYYGHGCFFQCLEGNSEDIDKLLDSLRRDTRHRDLEILTREPIESLCFVDWNMKYVSIDQKVQTLLIQHNMKRFDPYKFSPEMIGQLVDVFHESAETLSPVEVEDHAEVAESLLAGQAVKSRIDRIAACVLGSVALLGSVFMVNLARAAGAFL